MCLSIAHGGEAVAAALGEYASRWPGGPEPAVLVAAGARIGTLHGHAALARAWQRSAATDTDRQRAHAYAAASQDRLETIRTARSSGAGGAVVALTPDVDQRTRYEAAGRDAELSESRAQRFDDLADEANWDGDEHSADRHTCMAARCRESAALARQEQQDLLAEARDRAHRTAPC